MLVRNVSSEAVFVGGRVLSPGADVNVSGTFLAVPSRARELERLLQSGVVEAEGYSAPTVGDDSSVSVELSARAQRLSELVSGFPKDDTTYWMRDGRPQVSKINESLEEGEDAFDAAERDELWGLIS